MGQRVVTSLNHLDFKKNKNKNNNNANKKREKKAHVRGSFFSHKKNTRGEERRKKTERESREEDKIDSPVLLSTN